MSATRRFWTANPPEMLRTRAVAHSIPLPSRHGYSTDPTDRVLGSERDIELEKFLRVLGCLCERKCRFGLMLKQIVALMTRDREAATEN